MAAQHELREVITPGRAASAAQAMNLSAVLIGFSEINANATAAPPHKPTAEWNVKANPVSMPVRYDPPAEEELDRPEQASICGTLGFERADDPLVGHERLPLDEPEQDAADTIQVGMRK